MGQTLRSSIWHVKIAGEEGYRLASQPFLAFPFRKMSWLLIQAGIDSLGWRLGQACAVIWVRNWGKEGGEPSIQKSWM